MLLPGPGEVVALGQAAQPAVELSDPEDEGIHVEGGGLVALEPSLLLVIGAPRPHRPEARGERRKQRCQCQRIHVPLLDDLDSNVTPAPRRSPGPPPASPSPAPGSPPPDPGTRTPRSERGRPPARAAR